MTLATGAQAELGYIEEVVYGTTPATPSLVQLPISSFTPELTKEGFQSGDLRSDRQIADYRHGARQAAIGMEFELKHTEFDEFLEAALWGTWATDTLKASTDRKFFSMEAAYRDIAQFHLYKGMLANSFGLSLGVDGVVKCNLALLGQDMVTAQTSADSGPYEVPSAARSFDSFTGTIDEGGGSIAIVTGLDFQLENGLTPAKVVGSATVADFFDGRSNLTGTVNAFFEDESLLDKFLDETPSDIEFVLTDPDSETLTFTIPRIIYTGGSAPVSGEAGIVIALPFQATYDSSEDTNIKIVRS